MPKPNTALDPISIQLIDLAIREDLGTPARDLTTRALFLEGKPRRYRARIFSKEKRAVVICGLEVVKRVFSEVDPGHTLETTYEDGDTLQEGETLLTIEDYTAQFLSAERIALNFLQRLSGVATLTKSLVDKIKDTNCKILDTRKTTPGFRHLEKFAVQCGGGVNHRKGLYDALLIKNNHIDLMGGIEPTIEKLPSLSAQDFPVIMEIRTLAECKIACDLGQEKINRLLFDNMSPKTLLHCVKHCQGVFESEASGGITAKNIRAVAQTGVEYLSVGLLTHSAQSLDFSMHIDDVK